MHFTKQMLDVLEDCDCGPFGACCPASHQMHLVGIAEHKKLLKCVDRLTFRTTELGRNALRRNGREPLTLSQ